MEYYAAIKKNSFESILMRWMKLEPIIQSEVSQKEMHILKTCPNRQDVKLWEWSQLSVVYQALQGILR